jgi:hypothetical protein
MQQNLSLPDIEAAKAWRIQAETALRDPFYTQPEREKRAAYYLQRAEEIESGKIFS